MIYLNVQFVSPTELPGCFGRGFKPLTWIGFWVLLLVLAGCQSSDQSNSVHNFNEYRGHELFWEGFGKFESGFLKEALADLNEAVRLGADNAVVYHIRGKIQAEMSSHEAAIADYDRAIRQNPTLGEVYYDRGIAKDALGRQEEAMDDYSQATRLNFRIEAKTVPNSRITVSKATPAGPTPFATPAGSNSTAKGPLAKVEGDGIEFARIKVPAANLRSGPGTEYRIVSSENQNTLIEVTGQNSDGSWLQLASGEWIHVSLLDQIPGNLPRIAAEQPKDSLSKTTPVPTSPTSGNSNTTAVTPVPTATSIPVPTATSIPVPTATSTVTPTPAPDLYSMRSQMLALINEARAEHGLAPVRLGNNAAAQSHAEEMLQKRFFSHWNSEGLTPYMRYTLAGGHGYSAENIYFRGTGTPNQCIPHDVADWLSSSMEGLMNSPGHRANILTEKHTTVHLGIGHNCGTLTIVQLFSGEYIRYSSEPRIERGILKGQGRALLQADFSRGLQLALRWDPSPHSLTTSLLFQSSCYSPGPTVAFVLAPLPPNSNYPEDRTTLEFTRCVTPYEGESSFIIPTNSEERAQARKEIKQRPKVPESLEIPFVTARVLSFQDDQFQFEVDISEILDDWGSGVYTVVLFGSLGQEFTGLSEYSLFVD